MADLDAYPSFDQMLKSTEQWIDDVAIDRSISLAARGRSFATAKKKGFTLIHQLTATQWATLETLYDANRILRVTLTWNRDGNSYVCFFNGPPKYVFLSPTVLDVTVMLTHARLSGRDHLPRPYSASPGFIARRRSMEQQILPHL